MKLACRLIYLVLAGTLHKRQEQGSGRQSMIHDLDHTSAAARPRTGRSRTWRARALSVAVVVCTLALVSALSAHAGQGSSQWCTDGIGNGIGVTTPVTLGAESGAYLGDLSYGIVCWSTTPWGSAETEVSGGAIVVWTPTLSGGGVGCSSDPAAWLRVDCGTGYGITMGNFTDATTSAVGAGQATLLGTTIPVPGQSVGMGLGCTSGTVAVSGTCGASGSQLALSGTGCASGGGISFSATNCASGGMIGISGMGSASAAQQGVVGGGIAVSGLGGASAPLGFLAVSGTGPASSFTAISGTSSAYGGCQPSCDAFIASSGTGSSNGFLAISGTGNASSTSYSEGTAASGTGNASGNYVAVSGAGTANGGSALNVSGGDGTASVLGTPVSMNPITDSCTWIELGGSWVCTPMVVSTGFVGSLGALEPGTEMVYDLNVTAAAGEPTTYAVTAGEPDVTAVTSAASSPPGCRSAGWDWNWDLTVRGGYGTTHRGIQGSATVRNPYLAVDASRHVESLYVWFNRSNWIEYGWAVWKSGSGRPRSSFFGFRSRGTYGVRPLGAVSTGDHVFKTFWDPYSDLWYFLLDGRYYSTRSRLPFSRGAVLAVAEIHNQCDDATTHWSNLDRKDADVGGWTGWTSTHWVCDALIDYGYTAVNDREFWVDSRKGRDTFVNGPPCDPLT